MPRIWAIGIVAVAVFAAWAAGPFAARQQFRLNCVKLRQRRQATMLVLSGSDDGAISRGHQRLADFIRHNHGAIVDEWTQFARTRTPASDGMSKLALEDHVVDILKFIAADLESPQTPAEQVDKSHGLTERDGPFRQSAAEIHSALRLAEGFDIDQMVSEYRALRASVGCGGRVCCQLFGFQFRLNARAEAVAHESSPCNDLDFGSYISLFRLEPRHLHRPRVEQ